MAIIEKPLNPFTIANELGYYEYAPHPVTGQTVRKVDWGRLCTHENINKWSKYKPVRFPKDGELTEAEWKSTNYGLGSGTTGDVYSGKPIGGSISPFRISDFVGYNHDAKPPVSVEIISVNGATSAPFRIYKDEDASIEFKLIPGDIDPKDLSNETVREKNTNPSGGFGGLSWIGEISESSALTVEREPERVFGTEILEVVHTQSVKTSYIPRLEYMKYLGDARGIYETTYWKIRDKSYMSLFEMFDSYDGVGMIARPLKYNSISNKVDARVIITNLGGNVLNVRLRARYTINAPDLPPVGQNIDIFVEGDTFDLDGDATTNSSLPLNYIQQGYNHTYNGFIYLEKRNGNDWDEITYAEITNETIYIPITE